MNRRNFIKSTTAMLVGVPTVLGASAYAEEKKFANVAININGYGGQYTELFKKNTVDPLNGATGLSVVTQDETSGATVAKLLALRDDPPYDVILVDSPNIPNLIEHDLIDPVGLQDLPNLKKVIAARREFGDYGIPFLSNSTIITYNSDLIKVPIESYKDLEKEELKGKVGLINPENNVGMMTVIALAEANGGSLDNMQPAYDALRRMKDNIAAITPSTVTMIELYQHNEVQVGPFWDGRIYAMRASGHPMVSVIPKEGIYFLNNYLVPVKNSKKKEAALAYINQALTDRNVGALVEALHYPPCTDIHLEPGLSKDIVGYGDQAALVKKIDWKKVSQKRAEIIENFTKATR